MINLPSFDRILDTILTYFSQCPGCYGGGGDPQCKIRNCAKENGYQNCSECDSVPCDKFDLILGSYPGIKDELKEIKNVGLNKWCNAQQTKVEKGFRYSD